MKFETPCFHPNVDTYGNICLDILKEKWSAAYSVHSVLVSLQSLLGTNCLQHLQYCLDTFVLGWSNSWQELPLLTVHASGLASSEGLCIAQHGVTSSRSSGLHLYKAARP